MSTTLEGASDEETLRATCSQAVDYFNKFETYKWDDLKDLLHVGFKMKRIDDSGPNPYYQGRDGEVRGYFLTKGKNDQAVFEFIGEPSCMINGDDGVLWGLAWFTDVTNRLNGGPTEPRQIEYRFKFKKGADGNWRAIDSWGAPHTVK